jgi:hypothetical protein
MRLVGETPHQSIDPSRIYRAAVYYLRQGCETELSITILLNWNILYFRTHMNFGFNHDMNPARNVIRSSTDIFLILSWQKEKSR